MDAPEKIYVTECMLFATNPEITLPKNDSIEYTRTDAFIEKAIGWIDYNNRNGGCFFDGWEKDFRKYMKGE